MQKQFRARILRGEYVGPTGFVTSDAETESVRVIVPAPNGSPFPIRLVIDRADVSAVRAERKAKRAESVGVALW